MSNQLSRKDLEFRLAMFSELFFGTVQQFGEVQSYAGDLERDIAKKEKELEAAGRLRLEAEQKVEKAHAALKVALSCARSARSGYLRPSRALDTIRSEAEKILEPE